MGKSGIHINPKNKGKFNATKKATGKTTEELTHSSNPVTKKRAIFAQNAAKWHHAQQGVGLPTAYSSAPRPYYGEAQPLNMNLQQNDVQMGMMNSGVQPINGFQAINPQIGGNQVPDTGMDVNYANSQIHGDPKQRKPYNGQWGDAALAGLLAVDALIPNHKQPSFVNRPGLSYNEHPYGTGSSALMQAGGKISKSGYRADSPDRFEPNLTIPTGRISMGNVPHPVLGVDNQGNSQLMHPGGEYEFDGDYVEEYPMGTGGVLKPRHEKYQAGGNVNPQQDIQRMTPDQITYFNNFNDYVKGQGLQGSTKLNKGGLNEKLYSQYNDSLKTQNPVPLRDLTRMAQNEQHFQKDYDVDFTQRKNPQMATAVANSSISPIDDYYGSETSKRYIPVAQRIDRVNNNVVSQQNLGFVPNSLNAPKQPSYKAKVPDWAEIIDTQDGKGYYNQDATFVKLKNGGKMKKLKVYQQGGILQDYYEKGGTYDVSDEEIKQLAAAGYKMKFC